MNKEQISQQLASHYASFAAYINSLSDAGYNHSRPGKWSAAQQLNHMVLSVKPLAQVSAMDKAMIAASFGTTNAAGRSYNDLLTAYLDKLHAGGRAPERFVPAAEPALSRTELTGEMSRLVGQLRNNLATFTEQELDTLQLPHPLLGNITFREMMYNAIYHVQHHHAQTEQNLKDA